MAAGRHHTRAAVGRHFLFFDFGGVGAGRAIAFATARRPGTATGLRLPGSPSGAPARAACSDGSGLGLGGGGGGVVQAAHKAPASNRAVHRVRVCVLITLSGLLASNKKGMNMGLEQDSYQPCRGESNRRHEPPD